MIEGVLMSVLVLAAATGDVYAIDHTNLDEGRPLRLEDAYAIADGEIATEVGGGFTLQRRGSNQGVFPAEILYGAYPLLFEASARSLGQRRIHPTLKSLHQVLLRPANIQRRDGKVLGILFGEIRENHQSAAAFSSIRMSPKEKANVSA